ncbi:terminase small subunit [Clostridium perfringens]|uniref:terminase small subunit n=1 Tax=Clostridium perfringens TaxID=1502 RepID=UPI0028CFAF4A|nr:terminase small subunit [Clostridium perfringens]MDT7917342.1 terminase small subunit [Clostridium perfringens]MDT7935726.1 terminase small subunit [Clostridium perfringens]MDT7938872.1 terminase small subunit [Clostridium perfringens]MDT7966072.1 terminase small subunit [Clostridium perfringens]MDT7990763.1 terminase small subunit [Clostridium perfringens]
MKLTPKQKAFAEYYIETGNATEAARKAGYKGKNLNRIASENLSKLDIKSYIDEKMKELESKRIAKAEEVLEYLTRVLRGEETEQVVVTENIGDFMSEAKVVDKEISAKDKIKAAELLGKRYRLFVDKVEKDSNVNVNSTTKLDSILNQLKDDNDE